MMMKKIEMMEAKLWFALCALLLVNMGSAVEAGNPTTVQTPEPTKSGNSVTQLPSTPPAASSVFTEAAANKTGAAATNTTGNFSTPAPRPTQPTSNPTTPLHGAANASTQNETSTPTSVSAPEATAATAANATAATIFPTSASNATSSRNVTAPQPSTAANPSTSAKTKPSSGTTTALPNITSVHVEISPQLTMRGVNSPDSPRLDPLLVGLVSAFVIAAIVITLLLFLKFRRRQSGPQFHRLQDLPMDDMMEETPLSMYSY